jgi:MFS transporter, putative metabolite:H+ symporter
MSAQVAPGDSTGLALVDGISVRAGARLDRLPLGRFHRRVLWLVGLSVFFDFFDSVMAGGLVGGLLSSQWSTLKMNAVFLSASGVGGVVGNLAAGYFADRRGRRFAFQGSLLLLGLTTLISAAAPSMFILIILRFVACIGIAAVPTVGFSLLAELLPPQARGRWSSLGGTVGNTAIFFASLAGYLLIPSGNWRWMFVIPGVACLALCYFSKILPESPRWLEAVGRRKEAERTLMTIEKEVAISSNDPLPQIGASQQPFTIQSNATRLLLRRPTVFRLIFGITIALGANVAIFGFLTWLPTILLKQGFTISGSLGRSLLIATGTPLGALLAAFFADRLGRRIGIVSIAAAAFILAILFSAASASFWSLPIGFSLLMALAFLVNVIFAVYLPELFPTTLRVQGTASAAGVTKLAFVFLPFAMAKLLTLGGVVGPMTLIAACLLLLILSVTLFGSETAYKSLEETSRNAILSKTQAHIR